MYAFNRLKDTLCTAPILQLPDLQFLFEVETDASQFAMGVVLKQGGHPVAYHSETFSQAKQNYSTYDKEFYALVQALRYWRHFLLGKETIVHTDHQPLQSLHSQSRIQEHQHMKWASYLQQFHLVIKYKKGAHNQVVDFLN